MTRERLGSGDNPVRLSVGCHQKLTRTSVGKLIALELSSNLTGILCTQVCVASIAVAVGSLNDDTLGTNSALAAYKYKTIIVIVLHLRSNVERRELLFPVALAVVAWVNTHFDLCVQSSVDLRRGVEAPSWGCGAGVLPVSIFTSSSSCSFGCRLPVVCWGGAHSAGRMQLVR